MAAREHYAKIPSTVLPTVKRILTIFALIAISIVLNQNFDEKFYLTEEFKELGSLPKLVFMIGTLFQIMSTYVIGFCFMECGPIASGFSYNGVD
jgi:lysophospholipid acyltransferase